MKKIILKIGSLILLLITTVLISIGTFSCSTKENNNAYLFNNNIKVKRAYENAPEKETSLPGFNKEFKIYFNISTLEEFKTFFRNLNLENEPLESPILLYYGIEYNEEENLNSMLLISALKFENRLQFNIAIQSEIGLSDFVYFYEYDNEEINFISIVGQPEQLLTETLLVQQFNSFNNLLFETYFYSNNTFTTEGMTININNYLENQNYIYGYDLVKVSAVPNLINIIKDSSTGILNMIIQLFVIAIPIFWVNNKLTFIGTLAIFTVAVPIVYWVINFVLGLIKKIKISRK